MESLYVVERPPLDFGRLFWRQKTAGVLAFVAVLSLTLAYLALAPRKFQSEAKVLVRMGRESITLDPTATTGQFVAAADSRESEVHAVEELLLSRGLGEKIVDQFGPEKILEKKTGGGTLAASLAWLDAYNLNPLRVYSVRDKAVVSLRKNLSTAAGKKTNIVSVSYQAKDPKGAQDVLSALLQSARDEHLRVHRTTGSQEFFVNQSELLRGTVAKLEAQLRDLKDSTGFAALPTQRDLKLQLIGSLQGDLLRARAERDAAQAEVERRRQQLRDLPSLVVTEQTTGLPQTARQTLREKLYDLEVREQELAVKLTNEAPLLQHVRNQISEARRIMSEEQASTQVKKGANPTYQAGELGLQEKEAQLAALEARTRSLDSKVAAAQDELKQVNASEVELARLERELDLARANYRKYAENLEQARIDQELELAKISSLNLMQTPTYSITPISPQPIPTLAFGLAGAVICSFGAALLADRLRRPAAVAAISAMELPAAPSGSRLRRSEIAPANPR
jgi:uncharacterized protein involved in exopolysaccharide biosynthesis